MEDEKSNESVVVSYIYIFFFTLRRIVSKPVVIDSSKFARLRFKLVESNRAHERRMSPDALND